MKSAALRGACLAAFLAIQVPAVAAAETPQPTTAPLTKQQQRDADAAAKEAEREDFRKNGSWYLRCDGNPNNMTDGESFARLVGAISLLGLLAPQPETADPSKRLFAAKGVDACNHLIDETDKGEHNVVRRLPLILARAAHRIEAKDFSGAIADVDKARSEARAANLIGNPYFDRSMGLSFDLLESEARLRQGDLEGSVATRIRTAQKMPWSWYARLAAQPYAIAGLPLSDDELRYYDQAARLDTFSLLRAAQRLEDAGRFAEAAARREAIISDIEAMNDELRGSLLYASAALSLALAGEWDKAAERATFARANLEERRSSGKAETNESAVIEWLDLYGVVAAFHAGKAGEARRIFTGRSEWTAPSRGLVEGVAAQLLPGATPAEKMGLLAQTRQERENRSRELMQAALTERDKNNRTLFSYILPYAPIKAFEAQSKQVWTIDKSKMLIIPKEPRKSGLDAYFNAGGALTQPDALLLHAALRAQAAGKHLTFYMSPDNPRLAMVRFIAPDDQTMPAALHIDPQPVIAELSQVIPSPEALVQRQKAASR